MTTKPHTPLMIDVAGTQLSPRDAQRLRHPLVGGVILFARNWRSAAQINGLCASIKALRPDILIAVDHEGGRVQRFKGGGFTHLPPMQALGDIWQEQGDPQRAQQAALACGFVLAAELRACGVDLSFTPVLDLCWGASRVIGDRSFSSEPEIVTALAQSLMHGMLQAGMSNCAKHFPGHGFAQADSHVDIAVDERSLEEIMARDVQPYAWLTQAISSVMTAHVIYPEVDSRAASFSAFWLQDVLRRELGFEGVIFSDDLSMEAARRVEDQSLTTSEAAILALQAGCDMVLLCNQSLEDDGLALDIWLEEMSRAQAQNRWLPSQRSAQRCAELLSPSGGKRPRWSSLAELQQDPLYQRALQILPVGV